MQRTELQDHDTVFPGREACEEQMERLFRSHWFRESHQLQHFLRFVVEETLAGREAALKEYSIGSAVFHRGKGFDPRTDSIVRVQASLLRKKLDSYYREQGTEDPVLIEMPKGSYIPRFRRPAPHPPAVDRQTRPPLGEPSQIVNPSSRSRHVAMAGFLIGALAGILVFQFFRTDGPVRWPVVTTGQYIGGDYAAPTDFPLLWDAFFNGNSSVLLTYGQPRFYRDETGLFLRDVRINTGREAEADPILSRLTKSLGLNLFPDDHTYTGIGELNGMVIMSSFLSRNGLSPHIKGVRSLSPEELKGRNLILISSLRFQTLLASLDVPVEFAFDGMGDGAIRNPHRRPGEAAVYRPDPGSGVATSYAMVSLWPGVDAEHRILYLGGIHSWSTLAAVQYVTHRETLREMTQHFQVRAGSRPGYFQVLLKVEGVDGQLRSIRYVTHHQLKQKQTN